jgi:hypothetical protein
VRKEIHFDVFRGDGWPAPQELARYFLTPAGPYWSLQSRYHCWGLDLEGIDGTEHLPEGRGRADIGLTIVSDPHYGVLLQYRKTGAEAPESYYSKGDMKRLREWVRTDDGDLMPIGLYIPFEAAWKAVEEFMVTEGALPTSIGWIIDDDIPKDAFPDPAAAPPSRKSR